MIVPNCGRPVMKDFVPSMGSMTQTNSAPTFSPPYSSPMMPWDGKTLPIASRSCCSISRSAAVTGDMSSLSVTVISRRKYFSATARAASAASSKNGRNAFRNPCSFLGSCPRLQNFQHVQPVRPAGFQQHEQVIEQIGGFVGQRCRLRACRQRRFDRFLAHFLCNARNAFREQPRRIAVCAGCHPPRVNDAREIRERRQTGTLVVAETRLHAKMARRTFGLGKNQQRIAIAIPPYAFETQDVSRRLAFLPEPLLAAAEECHEAGFERFVQRLPADITQHQHAERARILHDRRDETALLVPVDRTGIEQDLHRRTVTPLPRRNSFTSPIVAIWR